MTERVYGNIHEPRFARTMGLSMVAIFLLLLGGVSTWLLMMFFSVPIYFAVIALLVAVAGAWFVQSGRKQGRTRLERWVGNRMFRKSLRKGSAVYVSGPTSRMPDGSHRAPGLLAPTRMLEGTDPFGRPFAFLWDGTKLTGTVFFTASAPGSALQDQATIDFLVSGWGGYLHQAGTIASLSQVAVTATSMRDEGERLPAAVDDARATVDMSQVPDFAVDAVDQIVGAVNQGVGRTDARLALTFSAAANEDEGLAARGSDELMNDVMVHLPAMLEQLELSGGGVVSYLRAQDVIDSTYVAFNPETAVAVERARLSGVGTGLTWEEVGPAYADARPKDWYEHGAGYSQTFQVWKAPAGVFRENSLMALMTPDAVCEMKRVTILYRPFSAEASQKTVQTAVTDTSYEAGQRGQRVTGAQEAAQARVKKTETEISSAGASLVRFSFVITMTVLDKGALKRLPSLVRNAAQTGVTLSVRPATANQDSAFAIGLGLGIVPAKWATLSPELRRAL